MERYKVLIERVAVTITCALFLVIVVADTAFCGKRPQGAAPEEEKMPMGVGPIKEELSLGPVQEAKVAKGEAIFELKCSACHKFGERYIGPDMAGITKRRRPEWILNIILNPDQMLKEDETARALLAEYMTPMTFQNVTEEDAFALLEFFRKKDQ